MRFSYPRFTKGWLPRALALSIALLLFTTIGTGQADAQSFKDSPNQALLAQLSTTTPPAVGQAPNASASQPSIAELVQQLGDPRYVKRNYAERTLRRLGLAAFDELLVATEHTDPEIAATSRRLLSDVTKEWHRDTDPELIRLNLIRYAKRSPKDRLLTIELMNRLPDEQGVEALCRLARYETSEQISKAAAAALLQRTSKRDAQFSKSYYEAIRLSLEEMQQQSGQTNRPAIVWLNELIVGNIDTNFWMNEADKEFQLAEKNSSDTNQPIEERLLGVALWCAIEEANEAQIIEVTNRLVERKESELTTLLLGVSKQLIQAEAWNALAAILENYQAQLQDRRGLYLRARVALLRGDTERATQLADQALAIPSGGDTSQLVAGKGSEYRQKALLLGERILIAEELDKERDHEGFYREWACRELEAASKTLDPLSVSVVYARWKLGELRHDSEEYTLAAESLADLAELVSSGSEQRRHYGKLAQQASWLPLPDQEMMISQRWLYEALASQSKGDFDQAEAHLEKSCDAEPTNADVLIAMYRLKGRSLEYMTNVRNRILASCRRIELEIAQDPTSPTPYNHWAWLVSNTEGDFSKAVRYSQRSLELSPDNPGYLDTLGRCLFSAGRIDEAIDAQQRAVEQMPSMQIMQRQLDMFYEASGR